jgi:hypothetical protein
MKRFEPCGEPTPARSSPPPRQAALWALVVLLAAPACYRWGATSLVLTECRWPDWPSWARAPVPGDLSAVKPYRNYLAVSQVDPIGEHFIVWLPLEMKEVRVVRDASGHLVVDFEGGMDGGVGSGPETLPAMPADVAALAHDLEAELREHCPDVRSVKIQYRGRYRRVTVQELIALGAPGPGRGVTLSGWFARYQVEMDESLQRVLGTAGYTHGAGMIEVARDAQWLAIPPGNGMKIVLISDGPAALASEIADAAQRLARGARGPALASLVPADAPLLAPGFVSRIMAKVTLWARHPPGPAPRGDVTEARLDAPIELHDAVFGTGATGDGETMLAGERYRMHATLTPDAPRAATPGLGGGDFRGTLALHIEDDHGHAWEHAYPAHGRLDLEGDSVVAPWGLGLPGASSPTPESEALKGQLPGFGAYRRVELRVDISTGVDPRR